MPIPSEYLRAAKKYGPQLDEIAAKYKNPVNGRSLSGTALLLKIAKGESGFRQDATSSAGAKGPMQFMPGTRTAVLEKSGGKVDPWRSVDEAMHAAVMHIEGKLGHAPGIESYNSGMPSYRDYILGQKVGDVGGHSGSGGGSGGTTTTTTTPGGTQTVQLPGAPQLDLQGLLSRITPAPKPQATGVPAPKFAAGQQFQSIPASPAPEREGPALDLAGILASAQPAPSTREYQLPGQTTTTGGSSQVKPPSNQLQAVIQEADSIDRAQVPYKWGGGHAGRQPRGSKVTPLDCSGAVSRVLGLDPRVSGQFKGWGRPGRAPGGKGVTIYSNDKHVLMEINGRFFGTSASNPGGGAGWIPRDKISRDYLSRFTARHSRRLSG